MVLKLPGPPSIFKKSPTLKDETFSYSQFNQIDVAGAPAGDYPEGTIFINTADNRVYMAITGSTAVETPDAAWWKFDESSGDIADSSGNGHTGTNLNTTTFAAGKYGNACVLDGNNKGFNIASDADFDFDGNFTFEWWMNMNDKTNAQSIFYRFNDGNNTFSLALAAGGILQLYWVGQGNISNGFISLDSEGLQEWHHYAIVGDRSSDTMTFYVDGILRHTETLLDNTMIWGGAGLNLGFPGAEPFDGEYDDFKVWNIARSPSQILADMAEAGGSGGTDWLYWDMIPA